jgi:hypothetical protein
LDAIKRPQRGKAGAARCVPRGNWDQRHTRQSGNKWQVPAQIRRIRCHLSSDDCLCYVNTRKQVGDPEHVKVFATIEAAETWFDENDPEGVAFEYEVLE